MNSKIDGYIRVTPDEYHTAAKIKWCETKKDCQKYLYKDRILYLSITEYDWLFGK